MIFGLDLIRALAILLITNSHLDQLYPSPGFATGGMLGNEMFFFISGYGLAYSLDRGKMAFGSWIIKREWRVFEPMFIATTAMILVGFFEFSNAKDILLLYTGIDHYWFLPIIMLFYLPLYFIINSDSEFIAFFTASIISIAFYVAAYFMLLDLDRWSLESHVASKAPFYFLVMLIGIFCSRHMSQVHTKRWDWAALAAATTSYLAAMLLLRKTGLFEFQFIIHLIGLVWIVALYRCAMAPQIGRLAKGWSGQIIGFLSATALQIYLLQEFFFTNDTVLAMPFPLNVAFFWLTLLPAAWILKQLTFARAKPFLSSRFSRSGNPDR